MTQQELARTVRDMRAELPLIGRSERILRDRNHSKVYLRLHARYQRLSLAIGHRDAFPDPEEAGQIAALFGAAGDPVRENMIVASQDGRCIKVPCLVYGWFEDRN